MNNENNIIVIPVTHENYKIFETSLLESIDNYYDRSIRYHVSSKNVNNFPSLVSYLHSSNIKLVQKNNKIIGFYVILENQSDSSVYYDVFLHPRACKMGVLTIINEGLSDIIENFSINYDVFNIIVHHSMLLSTIKNKFKEFSMYRITDNLISFSTKLNENNIIKDDI
jgi:hypothetical protein